MSETTTGLTAAYTWDATFAAADRLQTWDRTNGTSRNYGLDLIGNWNSVTRDGVLENRTHNDVHELTDMGGQNLTYAGKGQLLENETHTFSWDIDGHMLILINKSTNEIITFTYDALGRRTEKKALDKNTMYVSCGQRVCEEYEDWANTGTYAHARTYVRATYIDDIVAKAEADDSVTY